MQMYVYIERSVPVLICLNMCIHTCIYIDTYMTMMHVMYMYVIYLYYKNNAYV